MSDDRFSRFGILVGDGACAKLRGAKVLVCGLGAVGGFALEILARCGVEDFVLADGDTFELSNLNRQICALESTLGRPKAEVERERVLDINPAARVEVFPNFIDDENLAFLLGKRPDVVVDAIDSLPAKISLIKGALLSDIKLVSSMGAARRLCADFIKTAPLKKSHGCPMAAEIRRRLRAQGVDFSACECVFSDEPAAGNSHLRGGPGERVLGSYAAVTSIFGIRLADLAISSLLRDVVR